MTTPAPLPKIAVIVGSSRRESINQKAAQALLRLAGSRFEAKFVHIDHLPLFSQELETNMPANVVRYKDEILGAEGLLIVTTGHGRSIPAVLKNAIDWGARPYGKSV
jgi:chromate reductase